MNFLKLAGLKPHELTAIHSILKPPSYHTTNGSSLIGSSSIAKTDSSLEIILEHNGISNNKLPAMTCKNFKSNFYLYIRCVQY